MLCVFVFHTVTICSIVRNLPRDLHMLSVKINQPRLPLLIRQFLYTTLNPDSPIPASQIQHEDLPHILGKVFIYNSARAVFYAPSNLSGLGGMCHERIRSTSSWYGGASRRDCVFVANTDAPDAVGFSGLHVARVFLFFSFAHLDVTYQCALVHWFSAVGDSPDEETGMWMVNPDFRGGRRALAVIHLDTVLRGAHLIGAAGSNFLPTDATFDFSKSLDSFHTFYVNKYVDYHAHEVDIYTSIGILMI